MSGTFNIDSSSVGDGCPCFIITEIGVNHDGSKRKAKDLIAVAAAAGVDAMKYQAFKALDNVNPTLPADYDPQTGPASVRIFLSRY